MRGRGAHQARFPLMLRVSRRRRARPGGVHPDHRDVACNAPFTSMYLDQRGQVRACCQNDYHLLGNVTEQCLTDIWRGERARELRAALAQHDLDHGCDFCEWQVAKGRPDLAFARWFDEFPVTSSSPSWPQQLELAMSNTCNLQCVMCDGEWSSAIRAHRERRPPLPKVYDDAFFDDLAAFVPALRRVKFLGGEPFLASETLRVMDLLIESGRDIECHVTTNGTQWTPRVERVLEGLRVGVSVSVDAATQSTYEAIRVGGSWDVLLANLDRFQARAEARDTYLGLTFCLMVTNWQEFFDFCRMADDRGLEATVNTVRHPHHLSLYMLDTAAIEAVVAGLEVIDRSSADGLGRSRATWDRELERLRAQLADRRAGVKVPSVDTWRPNPAMIRPFNHIAEPEGDPAEVETSARIASEVAADRRREAAVGTTPARLRLDADGIVIAADDLQAALGLPPSLVVGVDGLALIDELRQPLGLVGDPVVEAQGNGEHRLRLGALDGDDLLVFARDVPADGVHGAETWVYLARSSRR